MPAGLVLQLDGQTLADYDRVNGLLGIDQKNNSGDWPPGLLLHAGGTTDDGNLVVMEVWESRDAQGRFMQERLGAALQKGGVTAVPSVTWVDRRLVQSAARRGGRIVTAPVRTNIAKGPLHEAGLSALVARYDASVSGEK